MGTAAGRAYAEAHDYGYVKDSSWGTNRRMWFIDDEPDIEEGILPAAPGTGFPATASIAASWAWSCSERGEILRAMNTVGADHDQRDGNFKPDGCMLTQLTDS